ncbi:MAG: hypothetical protein KF841_13245 [Phycisphaerae bacterium]|nr:hypothetical protein [Phycisphaerae bacterium]
MAMHEPAGAVVEARSPLRPRPNIARNRDHSVDFPRSKSPLVQSTVDRTPLTGAVVLETDVNGLGAIRSLAGLRPSPRIVGVDFTSSIGFRSRLCECYKAPRPDLADGRALRDFLLNLSGTFEGRPALFPSGDRTVRLICKYRRDFDRAYRLLLVDSEQVELLINKAKFADLARSVGARTPRTEIVTAAVGAAASSDLRFPIIAKPLNQPGEDPVRRAFKAKCFESASEWDNYFRDWHGASEHRVLIQERIPGEDSDIYFYGGVWRDGEPVCGFTGRKIRQHPKGLGSTVMALCERHDEVRRLAEQFLKRIRFSGLCDVEFKRDSRDGQFYLIEVNPRQGQWHRIGRLCGVDLVQAAFYSLANLPHRWPEQKEGPSGYWSYQFQDLGRLVDDWRRGSFRLGDWLRPYLLRPADGVFSWRDPLPWVMEFVDCLRNRFTAASSARIIP